MLELSHKKGIHLYQQGVIYGNWLIVPVLWEPISYTVLCLDSHANQYLHWKHYSTIELAIFAGKDLANEIIDSLTQKNYKIK